MAAVNDVRQALESEPLHDVPLKDLLAKLTGSVRSLATKEVELAKAELRSDVRSSLAMAKGLGVAAVCGLLGVNMLLVALVLALAQILPGWAAALIVAAPFILAAAVAGAIGWARRVRQPLANTRASLMENLEWVRDRLA
ncbi:MAG: phage holin family protein [Acidobacteriota bacterium]